SPPPRGKTARSLLGDRLQPPGKEHFKVHPRNALPALCRQLKNYQSRSLAARSLQQILTLTVCGPLASLITCLRLRCAKWPYPFAARRCGSAIRRAVCPRRKARTLRHKKFRWVPARISALRGSPQSPGDESPTATPRG